MNNKQYQYIEQCGFRYDDAYESLYKWNEEDRAYLFVCKAETVKEAIDIINNYEQGE